jgi:hypothetical protein
MSAQRHSIFISYRPTLPRPSGILQKGKRQFRTVAAKAVNR